MTPARLLSPAAAAPALLLLLAMPALAQAPARPAQGTPAPTAPAQGTPAPPPASPAPGQAPAPERTSAAYGDWVVRCENRAAEGAAPASRACEMAQVVQNQQQQPVAQIAVGRGARSQPWRLVVAVPPNIVVSAGARLLPEEGGAAVPLTIRVCTQGSCTMETEANDALLRRLRGREGGLGRIEYRLATEAEMVLPISFRGFETAFEALGREAG